MKLRPLAAAAVVLALGATGVTAGAQAAAKTPCNLLTDPAGDASAVDKSSDSSLDIVSADLATQGRTMTAVLRLAAAPQTKDTHSPTGTAYFVHFTAPGQANPLFLEAQYGPGGESYTYGDKESSLNSSKGSATGAVVGKEIHVTVPTELFATLATIKTGTKLSDVTAETYSYVGVPKNASGVSAGSLQTADDAAAAKPYVAGTATCVKVGS